MKPLVKVIEGPEYTCAMESAMHLTVMKHNDGSATFLRLSDDNAPNAVKVFVVRASDVEQIAGDLMQL